MSRLGVYLHVPFCTRRCDYCDFYVLVGREATMESFAHALASEIAAAGVYLAPQERNADTLYIGGGTPSLLSGTALLRLIATARASLGLDGTGEITLEANPEGINEGRLDAWRRAGVNRLSIGIQTLDDEALRFRGRLHGAAQALASIRLARSAGFRNINADLIAGLPEGPRHRGSPGYAGRFREMTERVLAEEPDHLSIYLFETDKDTPLMRAALGGKECLPLDDEVAEAHEAAAGAAARAGYEHYEISNFCRPGMRSRHNMKYWIGDPVLGLGPASHSFFRGRRFHAPRDLDKWIRSAGGSRPAFLETASDDSLPGDSALREALVLNLRLLEGVDLDLFDRRWGSNSRRWVREELDEVFDAGLLDLEGTRLRLTPRGVMLANEVFGRLVGRSALAPSLPARG